MLINSFFKNSTDNIKNQIKYKNIYKNNKLCVSLDKSLSHLPKASLHQDSEPCHSWYERLMSVHTHTRNSLGRGTRSHCPHSVYCPPPWAHLKDSLTSRMILTQPRSWPGENKIFMMWKQMPLYTHGHGPSPSPDPHVTFPFIET